MSSGGVARRASAPPPSSSALGSTVVALASVEHVSASSDLSLCSVGASSVLKQHQSPLVSPSLPPPLDHRPKPKWPRGSRARTDASPPPPSNASSKLLESIAGKTLSDSGNKSGGVRSSYAQRGRSVIFMSISLVVHLGGYELSRVAVQSLFTSDSLGFGNSPEKGLSVLPMAVGYVSTFSVALLWFYTGTLDLQIVGGWMLKTFIEYLHIIDDSKKANSSAVLVDLAFADFWAWIRSMLFHMFVFQNTYIQLLYNQHWVFISSVLIPEEGSQAFTSIAGLGRPLNSWVLNSVVSNGSFI